jgi:uncharacterized protein
VTRSPLALLLMLPVRFYQLVISPLKPKTCRFDPTCSSYALQALRMHGGFKGSWLTVKRLCRCHPFCEPGFDPVPTKNGAQPALPPTPPESAATQPPSPETHQSQHSRL